MAFIFPNPALEQTVTNPETGITYTWLEDPGKWIIETTGEASDGLAEEILARQEGDAALQSQIDGLQSQIDGLGGGVDLQNYYTKDEVDNLITLRGVGYNYLVSSFSGGVTIRPGELTTDNSAAGQITFISIAPEDTQNKRRRVPYVGDTIEIYNAITDRYYRYLIHSMMDSAFAVTYEGKTEYENDLLTLDESVVVYLYPTSIDPNNYYTKSAAEAYFVDQEALATALERYVDLQSFNTTTTGIHELLNQETAEPNVYYGDYAPTGTMKDGNLWFDSMSLRINVWSQGAWVNPDRNDGKDVENRITALEERLSQLEGN
jgi:hypothetical protein